MSAIDDLIEALQVLPGVGPKSAQRMALYLLLREREAGVTLAEAMRVAMRDVRTCSVCRNLTEQDRCALCRDERRAFGTNDSTKRDHSFHNLPPSFPAKTSEDNSSCSRLLIDISISRKS